MEKLQEKELNQIEGGAVSGTLVNALLGVGKFIYTVGQSLGSSIRRIAGGAYCPL